jgi:hypothetical protein
MGGVRRYLFNLETLSLYVQKKGITLVSLVEDAMSQNLKHAERKEWDDDDLE